MHILLIANVSQSYFNQRLAAAQLQVANDTLQNYQQSYAFVEKQLLTGSTTVLALEQARGMIESTRADIAKRQGSELISSWEAGAEVRFFNNRLGFRLGLPFFEIPANEGTLTGSDMEKYIQ